MPLCKMYMMFVALLLLVVNVALALVIVSANNEIKKLNSENAALRTQTRDGTQSKGN